jgi:hypothetical protein
MIVDKTQFDKFIEILPDLEKDEVYFTSLSARNKYLTAEERIEFSLGRTEMFSREIARDKEGLYYAMRKLRASLQYRKTNNGKDVPEKCLVVYININPSSMIKAYQMFTNEMNKEIGFITSAYMSGKDPNFEGIKRVNRVLMNCIQKSRARKVFIDIDIDLFATELLLDISGQFDISYLANFLNNYKAEYYKIQTKSGYHFMIKKDTVPSTLYAFISKCKKDYQIKEIDFNHNEMIPVPGTLQAGKLVEFVK